MKYSVIQTQPPIMKVSPENIVGRVDAHHYKPSFIEAASKVISLSNTKAERLAHSCKKIGQPSDIRTYSEIGIPILNAKNVRPLNVVPTDCPLVSYEIVEKHKKQELTGDDVLVVRTGANCGNVAWAGPTFKGYLVNSHVIPVRTKNKLRSSFLAAYLMSPLGQLLLEREMTGAAQKQVSIASLNNTVVPIPDRLIQDLIGSRIELAERCHAEAKKMYQSAFREFDSKLRFSELKKNLDLKGNSSWVEPGLLRYNLFAGAYLPKYIQLDYHIKDLDVKFVELGSICDPIEYGYMPIQDYAEDDNGIPFLRVTNIIGDMTLNISNLKYIPANVNYSSYKVYEGDAILVQCGNTTGKVGVITKRTEGYVYPSFSFRIKSKGSVDQYYLAFALQSEIIQMMLWRTVKYSTVRPNTTKPDIESLIIPILPDKIMNRIGLHVRKYLEFKEKALELVDYAKFDVSALIEDKLDIQGIVSGDIRSPTWEDIEKEINKEA